MDKEVGRVAAWLQEKAGDHVPLQGINTRVISSSYNVDDLVSIPSLIENASATRGKLAAAPIFIWEKKMAPTEWSGYSERIERRKIPATSPSTCVAVVITRGDDQINLGISAFYSST